MAEGVTFNPTGTVTVKLGDKAYSLHRPKLRQYRKYRDRTRELSIEARDQLQKLTDELEGVDEEGEGFAALEEQVRHITRNSFELTSVPWLKEVFEELGDPLPEDHEEWPAWLAADQSIPNQIIEHWRTVPLAPGAKGTN